MSATNLDEEVSAQPALALRPLCCKTPEQKGKWRRDQRDVANGKEPVVGPSRRAKPLSASDVGSFPLQQHPSTSTSSPQQQSSARSTYIHQPTVFHHALASSSNTPTAIPVFRLISLPLTVSLAPHRSKKRDHLQLSPYPCRNMPLASQVITIVRYNLHTVHRIAGADRQWGSEA